MVEPNWHRMRAQIFSAKTVDEVLSLSFFCTFFCQLNGQLSHSFTSGNFLSREFPQNLFGAVPAGRWRSYPGQHCPSFLSSSQIISLIVRHLTSFFLPQLIGQLRSTCLDFCRQSDLLFTRLSQLAVASRGGQKGKRNKKEERENWNSRIQKLVEEFKFSEKLK